MRDDLKNKLKEMTLDELLELLILGLEYEKLKEDLNMDLVEDK